jgi:hypothetical protein
MKPKLPKSISESQFVIVGYGDGYNSRVVKGDQLYPVMMDWMYGRDWKKNASLEDKQSYWNELCDVDQYWTADPDFGPIIWRTDCGETDHIEIFRITD